MDRGYIRITAVGPSLEEQQDALRSVGVTDFAEDGTVYVDQPPKRRRKPGESTHPQLDLCIRSCRKGDIMIVASPGCLAASPEDALAILAEFGRRGATLKVVSTDRFYLWNEAALDGLELARDTAAENRADILRKARAAATERRPTPKLSGKLLTEAKVLWADPKLTAAQVEEKIGVPVRTLYRRLGERGTPAFGAKGKKR